MSNSNHLCEAQFQSNTIRGNGQNKWSLRRHRTSVYHAAKLTNEFQSRGPKNGKIKCLISISLLRFIAATWEVREWKMKVLMMRLYFKNSIYSCVSTEGPINTESCDLTEKAPETPFSSFDDHTLILICWP